MDYMEPGNLRFFLFLAWQAVGPLLLSRESLLAWRPWPLGRNDMKAMTCARSASSKSWVQRSKLCVGRQFKVSGSTFSKNAKRTQRIQDSGHRPPLQQNPNQKRSGLSDLIRVNPAKSFYDTTFIATDETRKKESE